MITFSIFSTVLLIIVGVIAAIGLVCGAGIIAVFGDLILCGVIIGLIVKLFRRKRK